MFCRPFCRHGYKQLFHVWNYRSLRMSAHVNSFAHLADGQATDGAESPINGDESGTRYMSFRNCRQFINS